MNKDFDAAFDCSYNVLAQGIHLPYHNQGYYWALHPVQTMAALANDNVVDCGGKACSHSAAKPNLSEPAESSRSSTEDYYPAEWSIFMSYVNQNDLEDFATTGNELNLIRKISAAGEGLVPRWPTCMKTFEERDAQKIEQWIYSAEKLSPEEMFWKKMKENPHLFELWLNGRSLEENSQQCSFKYENMGLCENSRDNCDQYDWNSSQHHKSKRRLCRHFQKGWCRRGRACGFLHDTNILCSISQKVFLGGIPEHITEFTLRLKLAQLGYKVINTPRILRGFAPQVCMASVEEAQKLIAKKSILIDGSFVNVRAYEAMATEIQRSVFLGGLSNGTTSQMIKDDLEKIKVQVVNNPLIKSGFTHKVTLSTVKERNKLLKLKKVPINGTLVDVREYVKCKRPFSSDRMHN